MAFPPFPETPIPTYVIMAFQMMFAIITVALISGAISDRTKFAGWLRLRGRLVHPGLRPGRAHGSGAAASSAPTSARWTSPVVPRCTSTPVRRRSALALVARQARRLAAGELQAAQRAVRRARRRPAVVRLVRLQRRLGADRRRHHRAWRSSTPRSPRPPPCSAGSSWSGSGTASRPWSVPPPARSPVWSPSPRPVASSRRCAAVLLGLVAGAVCALAVGLKYKLGFDDSLDVVGVHFVGGWIGSLWIGLFATNPVLDQRRGRGRRRQRGPVLRWRRDPARPPGARQRPSCRSGRSWSPLVIGSASSRSPSACGSSEEAEVEGIDVAEHAESGVRPRHYQRRWRRCVRRWPGIGAAARPTQAPSQKVAGNVS